MRGTIIRLGAIVVVGTAAAILGQDAPGPAPGPPAPPSPHWYQCVAHGVTVTNLTPVAYFRGLLGMTPEERDTVLVDKSAEERDRILAKVAEYENMPRDMREERLRQTEMHWYMLTLLRLDPVERAKRLREISPLYQPMLMGALDQWDQLPGELRQAVLKDEGFLRIYVQWQGHPPGAQKEILDRMPSGRRAQWAEELNRWQSLPARQRDEMCQAFRRFFHLTTEERRQTVQSLGPSERRQMEQALRSYATLPPAMQSECVESFGKFAGMSVDERNQFLQNAAKWERMSVEERKLWRTLVDRLPPAPPGFYQSYPPMPPGMPVPFTSNAGPTNAPETAVAR